MTRADTQAFETNSEFHAMHSQLARAMRDAGDLERAKIEQSNSRFAYHLRLAMLGDEGEIIWAP